jgi:hypothetical protein
MQHRHGTVELPLRSGTTRDRKIDLAEIFFLGSCGRLGVRDTAMSGTISLPRYSTAEIDMLADDPGATFFHCHHQDHMDEGFAGLITYE